MLEFPEHPQHGLAEPDPAAGLGLLTLDVVPFAGKPHRQHVVGESGGLAPDRGESGVQPDQPLVAKHFYPREAIGVSPDRIEHSGEVHVQPPAPLLQEVGKQLRQLVMAERPFGRVEQLVPMLLGGGRLERLGHELVPAIGGETAAGAERAGEGVQQHQGAR